jgi:hypothetical protein
MFSVGRKVQTLNIVKKWVSTETLHLYKLYAHFFKNFRAFLARTEEDMVCIGEW